MSSEAPGRGPKGERGERGEQGVRGMPGISRGARRAVGYLLLLTLALDAAILVWGTRQTRIADARAQAQCRFDADLGGAAVTPDPKTGRPALLAVAIVSDARVAWHQAACDGPPPPASPSFRQWAARYRLPAG